MCHLGLLLKTFFPNTDECHGRLSIETNCQQHHYQLTAMLSRKHTFLFFTEINTFLLKSIRTLWFPFLIVKYGIYPLITVDSRNVLFWLLQSILFKQWFEGLEMSHLIVFRILFLYNSSTNRDLYICYRTVF